MDVDESEVLLALWVASSLFALLGGAAIYAIRGAPSAAVERIAGDLNEGVLHPLADGTARRWPERSLSVWIR